MGGRHEICAPRNCTAIVVQWHAFHHGFMGLLIAWCYPDPWLCLVSVTAVCCDMGAVPSPASIPHTLSSLRTPSDTPGLSCLSAASGQPRSFQGWLLPPLPTQPKQHSHRKHLEQPETPCFLPPTPCCSHSQYGQLLPSKQSPLCSFLLLIESLHPPDKLGDRRTMLTLFTPNPSSWSNTFTQQALHERIKEEKGPTITRSTFNSQLQRTVEI